MCFIICRGETHKNDVVQFITSQSRKCAANTSLVDRQSATLVWDLLALMVRQNGVSARNRLIVLLCHSSLCTCIWFCLPCAIVHSSDASVFLLLSISSIKNFSDLVDFLRTWFRIPFVTNSLTILGSVSTSLYVLY